MSLIRFFRRRSWDQERARELEAYLDDETSDNVARGMTPEEARRAAHLKLGNPIEIREEIYRMNTVRLFDSVWQDLRYAARLMRINRGFAAIAILSLALGIGANTAIFQLIDAIRLRALPVANPQELVEVEIANREWRTGSFSGPYPSLTNPLWEQVRDHQQAFSGMAAWGADDFNLARSGEARLAKVLWVSGDFFNVLGIKPLAGKVFTTADDRRACESPGAVISYSFWQREFGGDRSAIGKTVALNDHPFEVLGITPASFFGVEVGRNFDLAIPICSEPIFAAGHSILDARHQWWLAGFARLKPGWTMQRASAHLASISPGLFEATVPQGYGADMKDYLKLQLGAFPFDTGFSFLRQSTSTPLALLLATTGFILLIACANLANLLMARATAREREIAVRLAIGASRARLLRQILAESLLLAAAGAALGLLLARWLGRFLVSLIDTQRNPLFVQLVLDWRVLGFTVGVAILTCLLFGLTPALRASRTEPGAVMKTGGRGLTGRHERFGLRRVLVVAQVALSLVLLVSALLFVRSFRNLQTIDTGMNTDGVLITYLDLSRVNLPKDRIWPFNRDLVERINAIPGVISAADASVLPMDGSSWTMAVHASSGAHDVRRSSKFSWISPAYLKTMRMPLAAGRNLDDRDTPSSPRVAMVNESFVQRFFDGAGAIGKTFRTEAEPGYPEQVYQIVGVVGDTKYQNIREPFQPIVFAPWSQDPRERLERELLVRSSLDSASLIPALKHAISEISPDIVFAFRPFNEEIADTLVRERVMATLSSIFGVLAVLLAVVGLYGVMSYMVARRGNEIGIRVALGAGRGKVVRMILREASVLVGIGLIAGAVLSIAAGAAAQSLLFGLRPNDPVTLALAILALALVAVGASYLPARRASRLDPMAALREE